MFYGGWHLHMIIYSRLSPPERHREEQGVVEGTPAIDATYFWIGHLHSIKAAAGRTDLFLCTRHKESPKTAPQIAGRMGGERGRAGTSLGWRRVMSRKCRAKELAASLAALNHNYVICLRRQRRRRDGEAERWRDRETKRRRDADELGAGD